MASFDELVEIFFLIFLFIVKMMKVEGEVR